MKVFVAGATGALGKQLVPRLVAAGHEVVGMTRSEQRAGLVRDLGAEPAVADALDPDAVGAAVSAARPEVIVHQLTALSGSLDIRHFERSFARTNRLRTEGTDILLSAARAAGVRRFVAQSFAGWPNARTGGPVKTEDDPLDADPPAAVRTTLEAILYLERAVTGAAPIEGLALRYGGFYGPGTSLQLDPPAGEQVEAIRGRKFPIVGGGGGVWSFVHIEDAAEATAIAIERGAPGIYNIVDDQPAAVRDWLPEFARQLGAKPPFRVPRWVGRLVAGQAVTVMMTEIRGASNAKAKRELGWTPRHPSLVGTLAGDAA
jgi:nucleoside-diphosphate-sugar epimerase